jgi:hypothetical protein
MRARLFQERSPLRQEAFYRGMVSASLATRHLMLRHLQGGDVIDELCLGPTYLSSV